MNKFLQGLLTFALVLHIAVLAGFIYEKTRAPITKVPVCKQVIA